MYIYIYIYVSISDSTGILTIAVYILYKCITINLVYTSSNIELPFLLEWSFAHTVLLINDKHI